MTERRYDRTKIKRTMGGGLERYEFELPPTFFSSDTSMAGLSMKERLATMYRLSPKPDPREIVDVKVRLVGRVAKVTMTIQRGHYTLLRLAKEHDTLTVSLKEGYATCTCHPGQRHPLVGFSMPDYGDEL